MNSLRRASRWFRTPPFFVPDRASPHITADNRGSSKVRIHHSLRPGEVPSSLAKCADRRFEGGEHQLP